MIAMLANLALSPKGLLFRAVVSKRILAEEFLVSKNLSANQFSIANLFADQQKLKRSNLSDILEQFKNYLGFRILCAFVRLLNFLEFQKLFLDLLAISKTQIHRDQSDRTRIGTLFAITLCANPNNYRVANVITFRGAALDGSLQNLPVEMETFNQNSKIENHNLRLSLRLSLNSFRPIALARMALKNGKTLKLQV